MHPCKTFCKIKFKKILRPFWGLTFNRKLGLLLIFKIQCFVPVTYSQQKETHAVFLVNPSSSYNYVISSILFIKYFQHYVNGICHLPLMFPQFSFIVKNSVCIHPFNQIFDNFHDFLGKIPRK